jgi:hypothetical protein
MNITPSNWGLFNVFQDPGNGEFSQDVVLNASPPQVIQPFSKR